MNMRPIAFLVLLSWLVLLTEAGAAFAESAPLATITPASPEQSVQQAPVFAFLQEYFSALARGDVNTIAAYHPTLTPQQLNTLRDYFAYTVRDLHIELRNVQVQVKANTATVAFLRTDRFIDRVTERRIEKSIHLSTVIKQGTKGWQISGLDFVAFALKDHTSQAG